jgi:large subunit ribosomal protein L17
MRHAVAGYKLNRTSPHRRALFRNLAAGLFQHGQITTTLQKAKAVQPFVEKLITLARKGDLASRRRAIARLQDRELIKVIKGGESEEIEDKTLIQKLFEEIGPRYAERAGGYTRIVRLAQHRIGDGGDLVVLQLVDDDKQTGPSVGGRFSRRRQKQDNRTAFAAKLRRGDKAEAPAADAEQPPPSAESQQPADDDSPSQPAESTDQPEAADDQAKTE